METPKHMAAEMKWQARLIAAVGGIPYKEFKEDTIHYAGLVVFAFLRPKCSYIQLAHSISKFVHATAINDINNKVIGFIGDRDGDLKPYAVFLQEQKAWELATLNVVTDGASMTTHYTDGANPENNVERYGH